MECLCWVGFVIYFRGSFGSGGEAGGERAVCGRDEKGV